MAADDGSGLELDASPLGASAAWLPLASGLAGAGAWAWVWAGGLGRCGRCGRLQSVALGVLPATGSWLGCCCCCKRSGQRGEHGRRTCPTRHRPTTHPPTHTHPLVSRRLTLAQVSHIRHVMSDSSHSHIARIARSLAPTPTPTRSLSLSDLGPVGARIDLPASREQ